MGLLSGLEALGIKMSGEEEAAETKTAVIQRHEQETRVEKLEKEESSFLYEKNYTCPICDRGFTALTVKSSTLKLVGTDEDLRPRYEQLDPLKYDVVFCPHCGYANIANNFETLMPYQRKRIYENVALKFHYEDPHSSIYSYEEALVHYQFAVLCAMIGGAKTSEKAWLCLKMAWLIRGKAEELNPRLPVYEARMQEHRQDELEALQLALVGFTEARTTEGFPIAGMGETTLDFLISTLSIELGDPETAIRLLQNIIAAKGVKNRVKDRAREMVKKAKGMLPS